jgi:hypothetical protein
MVNKNNKLVFKVRKKVTDLTESMIGKIGDKKIQEIA